jgi:hypothetical protein
MADRADLAIMADRADLAIMADRADQAFMVVLVGITRLDDFRKQYTSLSFFYFECHRRIFESRIRHCAGMPNPTLSGISDYPG